MLRPLVSKKISLGRKYVRSSPTKSNLVNKRNHSIVVTVPITASAVDKMRSIGHVDYWDKEVAMSRQTLLDKVSKADGIYCVLSDKINRQLLDNAPNLKVISTMSAGFDHIDLEECKRRNIRVGYTPGVLSETTADLVLALLLATARRIPEASKMAHDQKWREHWYPLWMCGTDVHSSTVGIVGMGKIGQAVARRLRGFGCNILYHGPREHKELAEPVGATFVPQLDDLLGQSDFVIPLCPLNDSTRKLFTEEKFFKMKKGSYFINASRGPVVDQDGLVKALKTNHLAGAGLDVTDPEPLPAGHPLLDPSLSEKLVILPHIGSASMATRSKMADIASTNLVNGLTGKPLLYSLN